MQAAEPLDGRRHEPVRGALVGEIDGDAARVDAGLGEHADERVERLLLEVGDENRGSGCAETGREPLPEPPGGTGHQGDLPPSSE